MATYVFHPTGDVSPDGLTMRYQIQRDPCHARRRTGRPSRYTTGVPPTSVSYANHIIYIDDVLADVVCPAPGPTGVRSLGDVYVHLPKPLFHEADAWLSDGHLSILHCEIGPELHLTADHLSFLMTPPRLYKKYRLRRTCA